MSGSGKYKQAGADTSFSKVDWENIEQNTSILRKASKEYFSSVWEIFKQLSETLNSEEIIALISGIYSEEDAKNKDYRDSKERLNGVITLLQYEDILDQKMQHLLDVFAVTGEGGNVRLDVQKKSLLTQKVFELNALQLIFLKQEYKDINNQILGLLEELDSYLARVSLLIQNQENSQKKVASFSASFGLSQGIIKEFKHNNAGEFLDQMDRLMGILTVLEASLYPTPGDKLEEADLAVILSIYTVKSERDIFLSVFPDFKQEDNRENEWNEGLEQIGFFNDPQP